jgi:hypothetical protein
VLFFEPPSKLTKVAQAKEIPVMLLRCQPDSIPRKGSIRHQHSNPDIGAFPNQEPVYGISPCFPVSLMMLDPRCQNDGPHVSAL